MIRLVLALLTLPLLLACTPLPCVKDCPREQRVGAKCGDGSRSTATGSGACSHHEGVDCWQCDTTRR